MLFVLIFYLGLTLESTWAADYLSRSGRGLFSKIGCYFELHPPALALLVWCLALGIFVISGARDWGLMLMSLALPSSWVGLAHVGVIRRWHPGLRVAIYLALSAVGAVFWLAIRSL
jgi:hypothetical protein